MKTLLALAAVLGFSTSAALACSMNKDVNASVDTELKTASVSVMSTAADAEPPVTVEEED